MNSKRKLNFGFLLIMLVSIVVSGSFQVSASQEYDLPASLYLTGSVTFSTSDAPAKIRDSPYSTGLFMGSEWIKENGLVTLKVGGKLDAPVLFRSWEVDEDDTVNIRMDDNESIADEKPVSPPKQTKSQYDFGLDNLMGARDYVTENTTDITISSPLDLTGNSLIVDVNYLVLQDAYTNVLSSNSTIIVSFGISAAANISDIAEVTNATIYNAPMVMAKSYWWNLNLENTNASLTHVINIEIDNVVVKGHYTFDLSTTEEVKDARYRTVYIGSSRTEYDVGTSNPLIDYKAYNPDERDFSLKTIDGFGVADFLEIPVDFDSVFADLELFCTGWEVGNDLEDDIMDLFATDASIDVSDIVDYDIDTALFDWFLPSMLMETTYEALEDAIATTSDLASAVSEATNLGGLVETLTVSGGIEADEIAKDGTDTADNIEDMTMDFYAASSEGKKNSNIASDVKDIIWDGANILGSLIGTVGSWFPVAEEYNFWMGAVVIGGLIALFVGLIWYIKFK